MTFCTAYLEAVYWWSYHFDGGPILTFPERVLGCHVTRGGPDEGRRGGVLGVPALVSLQRGQADQLRGRVGPSPAEQPHRHLKNTDWSLSVLYAEWES